MIGQNMNLAFNLETIYKDCNFCLDSKDKVGIVGVNGAGKTTLFKVILKELALDSGKLITSNKRIGHLPQEISMPNDTVTTFDYLLSARPIQKLERDLQNLYEKIAKSTTEDSKTLNKISQITELLEYYDVYNYENVLLTLIDEMKLKLELLDLPLNKLSGGEKSKVAFIHLLYSKPEILLLDEPTNHLDTNTRNFIIDYLKHYKGMVLIISHDIDFLNSIVNKIMYIDKANKTIDVYNGNYDIYKQKLEQKKSIKEKQIAKQEKEQKALKDFVLQYSNSSGKRKRIAQSREKLLAKKQKETITKDKETKKVRLNIKPNQEGSKIPLKVNSITFGYTTPLYHNLSFNINKNERFLIVGNNGVGKSTLLKLIVGSLIPQKGTIWYGNKTEIAYYAQELELLDQTKTILQNIDISDYSEKELRTILGSFLFTGDDVFKKVNILSPGEKARIALCKIMLQKANLLILDEPTNHLDPETQKIIGENFKNYEGTIILVSHNPAFIETIGIDRMLVLPNGKITNYTKEKIEEYSNHSIN